MEENRKKICSIGVDIDPFWTYTKTIYDYYKSIYDPILDIGVRRYLEIFKKYNIKATFFIVGSSLKDGIDLREVVEEGHEVANHSMNHSLEWQKLSLEEKEREIKESEEKIKIATGEKTLGFRTPGWNIDEQTIQILKGNNYLYDSSVHPTILSPLIKTYKFFQSRHRTTMLGKIIYILAPFNPYFPSSSRIWKTDVKENTFLEIPITVVPFLKIPFYGTFILGLNRFYFDFFYHYFVNSLNYINLEFHGIELLDIKEFNFEVSKFAFESHSALRIPFKNRIMLFEYIIKKISEEYKSITLRNLAEKMIFRNS